MIPLMLLTAGTGPDVVTFNKHVAPILHAQCAPCHREGEAGPFPLLTFADANKKAKLITRVTGDKTMPPWKPDRGHTALRDERRLTDAQIETLAKWVEAGAPEGDTADKPVPPQFKTGWQLGTPHVVLNMTEDFEIPAEGRDVYHQFVFPLNLEKDTYLKGVECRPGNRRVAHHAVGILDASGTARKLDAQHKGPGYPGAGPGFFPAGFTPGYVPGQTPRFFDAETAITLKKGTDFVLQMHYHTTGKIEKDRTEVGLYFTKKPPQRNMLVAMLGSEEIDIPAGAADYRARDAFTLTTEIEFRNIWAHMHTIGKSVRVTAEPPGGPRQTLLNISDWDFNWQDTYQFRTPVRLPKGTVIRADFSWDNSSANPRNPFAPPRRIRHGEGSTDEMSGLILGGVATNSWDELGHWGAVFGHYLEISAKGWKYKR